MNNIEVGEYYAGNVRKEWRRLVGNPYQRIELATTLHFLELHLPAHGQVLDAGGGPGRYTLELAARGLATHFQTCTHPAVFGMSEHLRIVCRKL
jgi:hypothetical protein